MEISALRNQFDKVVGEVVSYYANVSEEQRLDTLQFQGELIAIFNSEAHLQPQEKTNLYRINSRSQVQELIAQKALNEVALANGFAKAESQTGVPRDVPIYGALLEKLGYVKGEVRETLMGIQAGERTRMAEEERANPFMLNIIKTGLETGDFSDRNFRREYADVGKPFTVKAQSVNHMADMLIAATTIKPELKENAYVNNARHALKGLAYHIYREGHDKLAELAKMPDNVLKPEAVKDSWSVTKQFKDEYGEGRYNLKAGLKVLEKGLKEAINHLDLPEEKKMEMEQLIDIRMHCANKVHTVDTTKNHPKR